MKTDKSIIADLPEKTEVKALCHLTTAQAALYQQSVERSRRGTRASSRASSARGLVLALPTRFKQICNHPSQWLHDDAWNEADSGKLTRLREIAEVVATRQDKMLVFTQFQEVIAPLAAFLGSAVRPRRASCCMATPPSANARIWSRLSRRTRRYRSSSCR